MARRARRRGRGVQAERHRGKRSIETLYARKLYTRIGERIVHSLDSTGPTVIDESIGYSIVRITLSRKAKQQLVNRGRRAGREHWIGHPAETERTFDIEGSGRVEVGEINNGRNFFIANGPILFRSDKSPCSTCFRRS